MVSSHVLLSDLSFRFVFIVSYDLMVYDQRNYHVRYIGSIKVNYDIVFYSLLPTLWLLGEYVRRIVKLIVSGS